MRPRSLLLLLVLLLGTGGARAQEWRAVGEGSGTKAGFAQRGKLAGLVFGCEEPGRVRLVLSGDGSRFLDERPRTLVLSVDGLAETTTVTAEPEPGGTGASRFARTDSLSAIEPLLGRLAKGREVEVAGPSGSFRLPLKGSGAALGRLRAGCGG